MLVHPQSVVHSMVTYADGSVIAQLGNPDMRTPIAQALAHPERIDAGVSALDLARIGGLTFEAPDFARFRALALAYAVLAAGGTAPAVFNAANEVAVDRIPRAATWRSAGSPMSSRPRSRASRPARSDALDDVLEADRAARVAARAALGRALSPTL